MDLPLILWRLTYLVERDDFMNPSRDPEGVELEYLNRTDALNGREVIEIGCGNGRLIWRYAESVSSVVGIDPDFCSVVEAATNRPDNVETRAAFVHGEAENLPFAVEAFECAVLAWSL